MKTDLPGILVVDDEFSVRDSLQQWFLKDGFAVAVAEDATRALELLEKGRFEAALVDLKMPGMNGLELQKRIHEIEPGLPVILITAFASVETAVQALKQGAFDYVTKPIDPDELSHLVHRAVEHRRLSQENVRLRETIDDLVSTTEIIGQSPAIRQVLDLVQQVSKTDSTVLILGESGTGKELIARAIHAASKRRYFPLVPVNCGAFPENLLEGELFGHERGAFTGAQHTRRGRLEMADRGTLFLDEIGAIPMRMQVDLLRVLESKELTRLGGSRSIQVDFRVISATNENLEQAIREGRFREDFYYRVNVFTIEAPPLRHRREDIPLLAEHFRQRFASQMDRQMRGFAPEALEILTNYSWPGNVRELSNAVERAMVVGKPPLIRAGDLPVKARTAAETEEPTSLADAERRHVAEILRRTDWNITRAAELLEIDRVTVYNKIKKHGLER